jgi:hypothetical protein
MSAMNISQGNFVGMAVELPVFGESLASMFPLDRNSFYRWIYGFIRAVYEGTEQTSK